MRADEAGLVEVEGIGPIMARTIEETLAEDRTRELIQRFRDYGLKMEEDARPPHPSRARSWARPSS